MVFSNNFFLLVFLPYFFLCYAIANSNQKNFVALIGSLFFYAWGAPNFIVFLLISLFVDFSLVELIYSSTNKLRKVYLFVSVFLNIAILAYFKYSNFFVEELNSILKSYKVTNLIEWTLVVLPIGISFITFHKLTYVIDTYRNHHKPLKSFSNYLLYILMFPHQIAGPIVRYGEIAEQLENRTNAFTIDNFYIGVCRFIIGLSKKVLIANTLGEVADSIFLLPISDINTYLAWIGILAYTFQIYFDFSGYSDMAIGLAKLMGFTFPENFNVPYIAQSITDFWRRWHITLGRFMKDYLYIPLGGNRVSQARVLINLWIVFLVSGLWHGASWNFVFWGAYHGALLVIDRLFLLRLTKNIFTPINTLFTFFLVMIGWVFFKAPTMAYSFNFIAKLFTPVAETKANIELNTRFWVMLIIAVLICILPLFKISNKLIDLEKKGWYLTLRTLFLMVLLIISMLYINSSSFNPFIYFRF